MIVAHYRGSSAERAEETSWWRAKGESLTEACTRAAKSELADGKMYSHQYRPGRAVCAKFAELVSANASAFEAMGSFKKIYEFVRGLTAGFHNAGPMLAFDTADRIALHRDIEPTKVHLHAGTAVGAGKLGLPTEPKAVWLPLNHLPGALGALSAREAEDVLCIYADDFLSSPEEFMENWPPPRPGCGPPRRRKRC
ncbi:MAG: hypothetical protein JWM33_2204 [Caulobacteraceae bacterium]|nr:hypothetical protein [Caulobacteraceae bacterium]